MMVFRPPPSHPQPPSPTAKSPRISTTPHEDDTPLLFDASGKPITPKIHGNRIVLSLGLTHDGVTGWEAAPTNDVLDLSKLAAHSPTTFFRPIRVDEPSPGSSPTAPPRITLEKDRFYILVTKERISVPTWMSAEMSPFSHHVGELRAHYAGFFDPGFGFGRDGSVKGTVGVLEVRPHETVTIYDGQPICLMEYFLNSAVPERVYGDAGNSYMHQRGPKLAKYFFEPSSAGASSSSSSPSQ